VVWRRWCCHCWEVWYRGVAAREGKVEKLMLLRCRKTAMERKKMKKLALVVVVVTVTSEQMGWWRRFGRF